MEEEFVSAALLGSEGRFDALNISYRLRLRGKGLILSAGLTT
jgi:hypothetical protein